MACFKNIPIQVCAVLKEYLFFNVIARYKASNELETPFAQEAIKALLLLLLLFYSML